MATDPQNRDDLMRLNALIDGELAPAEHAALAARIASGRDLARAHATLASLKAAVSEIAETTPGVSPHRTKPRRYAVVFAGFATAAAVVIAIAAGQPSFHQPPSNDSSAEMIAPEAAYLLAALPAAPAIPDLSVAGLTRSSMSVERHGDVRTLLVTYSGPRGCRLELRVRPAGSTDFPSANGSSHSRTWVVGGISYQIAAFGMPSSRFSAIALAAEAATREDELPARIDRAVREARAAAPPCMG